MNDPGLDDAIADEANALDQYPSSPRRKQSVASSQDRKPDQLDNQRPLAARWWLASTAYPLAAVCIFSMMRIEHSPILTLIQGTFGPMASAFNIGCLAQTWRMEPGPHGGMLDVTDPKWYARVDLPPITGTLVITFF